jgi:hypothetical protein
MKLTEANHLHLHKVWQAKQQFEHSFFRSSKNTTWKCNRKAKDHLTNRLFTIGISYLDRMLKGCANGGDITDFFMFLHAALYFG